jgi:hypothetical protein
VVVAPSSALHRPPPVRALHDRAVEVQRPPVGELGRVVVDSELPVVSQNSRIRLSLMSL